MTERKKNILLAVISVMVTLIGLEGILRFLEKADYTLPIRLNADGFVTHKPNLDKLRFDNENKKKVHIKTNAEGFVGPNYTLPKPGATARVAVFDDSFTEAMQVNYEENFSYLLEQKLNAAAPAGHHVEVLNFGMGGTGTADAMIFYNRYARKYDPDVVVLAFYVGNDIADNALYHPQKDFLLASSSEWSKVIQPTAAGQKGLDYLKDRLYRSLALVRFIDRVVRSSDTLRVVMQKVGLYRPASVTAALDINPFYRYYVHPPDPEPDEQINYSIDLINNFAAEVNRDGRTFLIMYIPEGLSLHAELLADYIFKHPALSVDNFTPAALEDRLARGLASSTPFVRLSAPFTEIMSSTGKELYLVGGTGHINEAAHAQVGDLLFERLEPLVRLTK